MKVSSFFRGAVLLSGTDWNFKIPTTIRSKKIEYRFPLKINAQKLEGVTGDVLDEKMQVLHPETIT
jgi:hypothetical protein